jgi:hypothetical protein
LNRQHAFTIWINDAVSQPGDGDLASCAERFAEQLGRHGWDVETFDAEQIAREAYRDSEDLRIGYALGLTLNRLNRRGIIAVVHGHHAQPDQIRWGRQQPERLMHLWCGGTNGAGPKVALKPEAFRTNAPAAATSAPMDMVVRELERRGWFDRLEAEEAEDDPTVLPRLRQQGLL